MTKVIVTAKVEDLTKWEEGFRTHADLFRNYTVSKPINYAMNEGNEVAVCVEPENFATFMEQFESPATREAMAVDGIIQDSVKLYVLDHDFDVTE